VTALLLRIGRIIFSMVIVEEPAWKQYTVWILYALIGMPILASRSLPMILGLAVAGFLVSWFWERRQRASVSLHDGLIIIANRYSTHEVPIDGAKVEVGRALPALSAGDEDLDMPRSSALYIVPAYPDADRILIDAARGLPPREFRRVAVELQTAVAVG